MTYYPSDGTIRKLSNEFMAPLMFQKYWSTTATGFGIYLNLPVPKSVKYNNVVLAERVRPFVRVMSEEDTSENDDEEIPLLE